jgi:hypothetical protein
MHTTTLHTVDGKDSFFIIHNSDFSGVADLIWGTARHYAVIPGWLAKSIINAHVGPRSESVRRSQTEQLTIGEKMIWTAAYTSIMCDRTADADRLAKAPLYAAMTVDQFRRSAEKSKTENFADAPVWKMMRAMREENCVAHGMEDPNAKA